MKLIIAIVQDKDSHILGNEFSEADIRATRLSTTGGFLRAGNTTFLIGIEDERVQEVLDLIKDNCQAREQFSAPPIHLDSAIDTSISFPIPVTVGGATVFVLPIDEAHRF